jgi:hypothetical protein
MKFASALACTLLSVFISVAVANEDYGLCCLCNGCSPAVSGRGNLAVDDQGYTCTKLILDMADSTNDIRQGNAACISLKGRWYNHCCNPNHSPAVIAQAPTSSPGDAYSQGPNSWCDLCANGKFPGKPTTVIAVLDHPLVSTCRDLYWRAQKGYFEDRLCLPLRNYYVTPCGCNDDTTSTGGSSNGGGSSSGGAPVDTGGSSSSTGSTNGTPDKKDAVADASKDASKMYGEEARGNLNRQRGLKGSN